MLVRQLRIRVSGTVQGVGFRPAVWRIANDMGLAGTVRNDSAGVVIELNTSSADAFLSRLLAEAPPLSRIDTVSVSEFLAEPPGAFAILESSSGTVSTAIAPDAATCPACLAEIHDSAGRRFHYPFTNCTHCGPRLSIVARLPYDRANTTMSGFPLCADCQAEYSDPADRRFHAQPIACPVCGPRMWYENESGAVLAGDPIELAALGIKNGQIIAVKGIGGFHLACDSGNAEAVARLRKRKNRMRKPLALMVQSLDQVQDLAEIADGAAALLASSASPIVLLRSSPRSLVLPQEIAPGQSLLGFMLPYSPLHHLLMQRMETAIVLTSGNLSDDPQVIDNDEARRSLEGLVDGYLFNDRPIAQRIDDSVVRPSSRGPVVLRRGRGLAPRPIMFHRSFRDAPSVMAMGGDLKGAIAFSRAGEVTLSQHLGDLSSAKSRQAFAEAITLYGALFDTKPALVATDLHPEFHSTRRGLELAQAEGVSVWSVQHHHGHIASCMAENGLPIDTPPVLGIALDGIGLGDDGTVWGGEFMLCSFGSYRRLASFEPVPLPGGDQASRQPWRNLYAHLRRLADWPEIAQRYGDVPAVKSLQGKPLRILDRLMDTRTNAPLCSSAGRLLDACAALLGLCFEEQDYEGEAPSLLESSASDWSGSAPAYPTVFEGGKVRWAGLFAGILHDLRLGRDPQHIARRVHETVVESCLMTVLTLAGQHDFSSVALSGGCFNNIILLELLSSRLEGAGFQVLTQQGVPCGDGGLALGQCAVAMAKANALGGRQ